MRTISCSFPRSSRLREYQTETRAAAGRRLHFHLSIMQLDDAVDHGETDTGTLFLGREVEIENLTKMIGGNADACIFDVHFDPVAGGRMAGHFQCAAIG